MSNEPKLDAEQICYRAKWKIQVFLGPFIEDCEVSKDEGGQYFVFRFTKWDISYPRGVREIGRFAVLGAMIEDGIMSEQRLHAALWHTLGQIRGMV
jgi:hypothetical protein